MLLSVARYRLVENERATRPAAVRSWQFDLELSATEASRLTDGDIAVVAFDDRSHQSQTESASTSVASARFVESGEAFKHAKSVDFGDSKTVVLNYDLNRRRCLFYVDADTTFGVGCCVVNQVGNCSLK